MASEKLYESFCQKTTFKKTARHYNSRYFCDLKKIFKKMCHDHAGSVLCLLLFCLFFCRKMLPDAQGPQIIPQVVFLVFTISTLRPSSQDLERFTKILASIKDFLKKQASKLLSCLARVCKHLPPPPLPPFASMLNDLSWRSCVSWVGGIRP